MLPINTQFCVRRSLESREKFLNMFQNVSGLHFTKFLWIPRTNTCSVISFVGTFND